MNQPPQFPFVPGQMPQQFHQPAQATQFAPQGLPQQPQQGAVDLDSLAETGEGIPYATYAGGLPWYLTVSGACEKVRSLKDGSFSFYIHAIVRQSPDPNFQAGMMVKVACHKLEHPLYAVKAAQRQRDFLAASCAEAKSGHADPNHFKIREQQALAGQLSGRPFVVTFTEKTSRNVDKETGLPFKYLIPAFQAG